MGRYDNPLHVGVDAVSRGREVPVTRGNWDTCGRVGRDRCPVKKARCVCALQVKDAVLWD